MAIPEVGRWPQPAQALVEMLNGEWVAKGIAVTAEIGIADELASGAKNVEELAAATSTNADALYRLLRALSSVGVFAETGHREFALTPLSECLRSEAANSMRGAARMRMLPVVQQSWAEMLHCVRTGESGFSKAWALPNVFEYFADHPNDSTIFDDAMTNFSRNVVPAVAEGYDFRRFRTIVDVGGGHGILLITILRQFAGPRGLLFDLGHVAKGAQASIAAAGLTSRCEVMAGDMFESVPEGADAYIMKSIVHGFDNSRATLVLKNIRRAITADGRLLLVEHVIPDGNQPSAGKLADMQMLVMTSGRERTRREFEDLLGASGFRLAAIHRTAAPQSIVEGVPA